MLDAANFTLPMLGRCRCGQLRYRLNDAPRFTFACHCTDCQQHAASPFALGMAVPREGFSLKGQPESWERGSESGGRTRQYTCPVCKTWTHSVFEREPDLVIVRPTTLEDHGWVRPVAQIFTRSALPWAMLDVPVSYQAGFPDTERMERAFTEGGFSCHIKSAAPQAETPGPGKRQRPAQRGRVRHGGKEQVKSSEAQRWAGRNATAPTQIPLMAWVLVLRRAGAGFFQDRVMEEAASVTFYVLLALFPAIAAVISFYGMFISPAHLQNPLSSYSRIIPGGGISLIQKQVSALTSNGQSTLGFAAFFSTAVSLWTANYGIQSLIGALNVVYHEDEKRNYFKLLLVSFAFTLGMIALGIIALFSVVAVPIILNFFGIGFASAVFLNLLRWPGMLVVVATALAVIYRYGPSRRRPKWRWVSWGAGVAAVVWVLVSLAFSFYVANFGTYNKTYGSLGAVVGFMTWIWISVVVVLMGAEMNAELEQQTDQDTTIGPDRPRGSRGAYKADVKT